MDQHPSAGRLQQWLDGRLDPADSAEIETHLAACAEVCSKIVKGLSNNAAPSTIGPSPNDRPAELPANTDVFDKPERIGRFRIEKILGEGGFGRVYLAHDDQLNRAVAIKVPRQHTLSKEETAAYLAEARLLASLDHPHIVPVHDVGTSDDGQCFVVSKLIKGHDLFHRLRESQLSFNVAAGLIADVAEALHYAHSKGIVHRDIKPGNILLDAASKPYVADFGLALKIEDFGRGARFAGTLAYMSPEQARGEGHRVDGRSDIFSLGVVFYEMLAGKRPFRGDSQAELIEHITQCDPRPPRQLDDSIPKELERICLKAISKRASERYPTAKDMADDLRHFLAEQSPGKAAPAGPKPADMVATAPVTQPAVGAINSPALAPSTAGAASVSDSQFIKVVPKGLRSFDARDADFFLELLPGPRDRHGLPDSLRFWKSRIEETDADQTFAVGLIYGPSGCGKSSLVKAGLMPHLADSVICIYLEATAEDTEVRLLNGLRKRCPALSATGLKDATAALRRGQGISPGKKVVIVIDQFEQWLHAKRNEQDTELSQALRQCDGGRLQCIVMVRDDFWLGVSRLFRELEVRLLEGHNSALADLFDLEHAKKVLAAFGRAFGRLPQNPSEVSKEQRDFLEQAIQGLAQEGKVICVRLALFAEMMKGKPWTPATLKEVGGTAGVGLTFLEETFAASTAPPQYRLHVRAAQAVLKTLLPEAGTDIKGHMRSRQELLEASNYAGRPRDFEELLAILDGELRLITPTDPEGASSVDASSVNVTAGQRYYQLTHDYLVHSLRDWLTRKQKETRRGRAELQLAERAVSWNSKPENRHLPTWWEWMTISLFTKKSDWTRSQRKMMRAARWYHLVRGVLLVAILGAGLAIGLSIRSRVIEHEQATHADEMVKQLLAAKVDRVPGIVAQIGPYRRWADAILRRENDNAAADRQQKLHVSLALLPVDADQVDYLYGRLLAAEPHEFPVIRDALTPHNQDLLAKLWAIAEHAAKGKESQRLRAAGALASYDPKNARWAKIANAVAEQLVAENPVYLSQWMDGLRPVRLQLVPSLAGIFKDRRDERTAERSLATNILADYAADQPATLADLVQAADEKQFAVLFPLLSRDRERIIGAMNGTIAASLDAQPSEEEKEVLAKRQANAAVTLLKLGQAKAVWPLLQHRPDPRVRSFLIHRVGPFGVDPQAIARRLDVETDVSIRRALLLCLGDFGPDQLSESERQVLLPKAWKLYHEDADAGLHSAAEWLLRCWGQRGKLAEIQMAWMTSESKPRRDARLTMIAKDLNRKEDRAESYWHVNVEGQTMIVLPGPLEFDMGSPPAEASRIGGREAKLEMQHRKRIGRSFAIAAREVTVEQFHRFLAEHKELSKAYSPTDDSPVNAVSWYLAAAYCNWLSERDGIPKDQWCYLPNAKGQYADGMKIAPGAHQRIGYRLPTEAEWEYACRANARTSRFFGQTEDLLGKYAWYAKNAADRGMLPGVPGKLGVPGDSVKPNDFGCFDMLGNVLEWCEDRVAPYEAGDDKEDLRPIEDKFGRVMRGGAFTNQAIYVRCAVRSEFVPTSRRVNLGFRVARTFPTE